MNRSFRAKQVWTQLWKRAATYEQMSDVSPALRERLAADLPLGVEVQDERTAYKGATQGALASGRRARLETVLMGYRDRVTVCVSSQSGCAMGCTFCAAGQMSLKNNLTAGEIAAQVVWARREAAKLPASTPQRLTNVVFMGMGEAIGGYLLPSEASVPPQVRHAGPPENGNVGVPWNGCARIEAPSRPRTKRGPLTMASVTFGKNPSRGQRVPCWSSYR